MRKKINFIKFIQVWGIIFLVGLGVSIVAIDLIGSYRDFNFRSDQMREDYIARQKQIIKQEVNRVVAMIRYEKEQSERLTRNKIKSRVYEAYSIAQHIYQQNQAIESKAKIQQMILNALRPIRFENKNGYYFAVSMDGVAQLYPVWPELEGKNLIDLQDLKSNFIIQDEINVIKKSGEGFVTDFWPKPGKDPAVAYLKISFVKYFKPLDWYFGTGLYVDDVERQIKADLLSVISRIRFGTEGYVFVNRLNGDALVSNGKLVSGTKKLWEIFNNNPEKTKELFDKEYNAALKPEGDYIYYSLIKLTNLNKESPKVSFIYGLPELQWLVGAGVYIDDVETDIALMQRQLNNQIKAKMLYSLLIVIVVFAVFFLFYNRLNQGLKKDFKLFISFFNRAAHSDEEIDRENFKFFELDQMAEYANKMLADRKQTEASLEESEKKYRGILESIEDGYYEVDITGNFAFFNNSMCGILGYSKDELLGMNNRQIMDKKNARKVLKAFNLVFKTGEPHRSMDWELIRKDGSRCYVETSVSLINDAKGQPIGFQGISRDVTDRKQLEEQLRQAHKMESIGTLAGGIAHDFNNFLYIITGNAELALRDLPEWNPTHANLKKIKAASLRAAGIVKQLLNFTRKTDQELKPIGVITIIKDVLKFLRSTIPATIEIRRHLPESDLTILADPVQINQVMMNICTNASQAMEETGGIIEVAVENESLKKDSKDNHSDLNAGDYVKITISDTGPGIDPEIIDRIFDPYFTTKEFGKGTGMGLAVVHGIVKNHNGAITVDSQPGKGVTFTIFFPVVAEAPVTPIKTPDELLHGTETILFVDDEESIADMTPKILEHLGYTVESKLNPLEALALFQSKPDQFDLVITDMTMPQMTGVRLSEKIKAVRPDIPVIICTGHSALIDEEKAKKLGIAAFVMKPIMMSDIAQTIRKVLDNKENSNQ